MSSTDQTPKSAQKINKDTENKEQEWRSTLTQLHKQLCDTVKRAFNEDFEKLVEAFIRLPDEFFQLSGLISNSKYEMAARKAVETQQFNMVRLLNTQSTNYPSIFTNSEKELTIVAYAENYAKTHQTSPFEALCKLINILLDEVFTSENNEDSFKTPLLGANEKTVQNSTIIDKYDVSVFSPQKRTIQLNEELNLQNTLDNNLVQQLSKDLTTQNFEPRQNTAIGNSSSTSVVQTPKSSPPKDVKKEIVRGFIFEDYRRALLQIILMELSKKDHSDKLLSFYIKAQTSRFQLLQKVFQNSTSVLKMTDKEIYTQLFGRFLSNAILFTGIKPGIVVGYQASIQPALLTYPQFLSLVSFSTVSEQVTGFIRFWHNRSQWSNPIYGGFDFSDILLQDKGLLPKANRTTQTSYAISPSTKLLPYDQNTVKHLAYAILRTYSIEFQKIKKQYSPLDNSAGQSFYVPLKGDVEQNNEKKDQLQMKNEQITQQSKNPNNLPYTRLPSSIDSSRLLQFPVYDTKLSTVHNLEFMYSVMSCFVRQVIEHSGTTPQGLINLTDSFQVQKWFGTSLAIDWSRMLFQWMIMPKFTALAFGHLQLGLPFSLTSKLILRGGMEPVNKLHRIIEEAAQLNEHIRQLSKIFLTVQLIVYDLFDVLQRIGFITRQHDKTRNAFQSENFQFDVKYIDIITDNLENRLKRANFIFDKDKDLPNHYLFQRIRFFLGLPVNINILLVQNIERLYNGDVLKHLLAFQYHFDKFCNTDTTQRINDMLLSLKDKDFYYEMNDDIPEKAPATFFFTFNVLYRLLELRSKNIISITYNAPYSPMENNFSKKIEFDFLFFYFHSLRKPSK